MPETMLVVLTKYADIFSKFYQSVTKWEPTVSKIVVQDGDEHIATDTSWKIIHAPIPFNFSRNVNIGWNASLGKDVILIGDDVELNSLFVSALRTVAYQNPRIGIVVPKCLQSSPFVCGYFKREMLDAVGSMDEGFSGYGYDDDDFLIRMTVKNFFVTSCNSVWAAHPTSGTTYARTESGGLISAASEKRYKDKWDSRKWNTEENYLEYLRGGR